MNVFKFHPLSISTLNAPHLAGSNPWEKIHCLLWSFAITGSTTVPVALNILNVSLNLLLYCEKVSNAPWHILQYTFLAVSPVTFLTLVTQSTLCVKTIACYSFSGSNALLHWSYPGCWDTSSTLSMDMCFQISPYNFRRSISLLPISLVYFLTCSAFINFFSSASVAPWHDDGGVYVTSHSGIYPIPELYGHPNPEIPVWDGVKLRNIMRSQRFWFAVGGTTRTVAHWGALLALYYQWLNIALYWQWYKLILKINLYSKYKHLATLPITRSVTVYCPCFCIKLLYL